MTTVDVVELTILGCSGTYAGPGGACSGYLIRSGDTSLLVDCGPGSLALLQEFCPLESLSAVVISHSHPDHWGELPVLRNALHYVLGVGNLPVFGTAETLALATSISPALTDTYEWTVLTPASVVHVDEIALSFSRTDHPPETLAMRIEADGRSLGYSADTGPRWELSSLGTALEVALCEATYLHREIERAQGAHLSAREAGETAARAGVKRLVITHQVPGSDVEEFRAEAAAAFGGPVEVASSRMSIVI